MIEEHAHGKCISFGFWEICKGDRVVLVDVRGRVVHGVVHGFYAGFIAFSERCDDPKPTRFIKIQYIMEVDLVGKCTEEQDNTSRGGG